MAHSIKNPEILHWVEDDGKYACNKAVKPTPMKTAFYVQEITCKNCKKILDSIKLSDHLAKFLPNELGRRRSECCEAREIIGKAKQLEEIENNVNSTQQLIMNRKQLAWDKKVLFDKEFLLTVLDDINRTLFPDKEQREKVELANPYLIVDFKKMDELKSRK